MNTLDTIRFADPKYDEFVKKFLKHLGIKTFFVIDRAPYNLDSKIAVIGKYVGRKDNRLGQRDSWFLLSNSTESAYDANFERRDLCVSFSQINFIKQTVNKRHINRAIERYCLEVLLEKAKDFNVWQLDLHGSSHERLVVKKGTTLEQLMIEIDLADGLAG